MGGPAVTAGPSGERHGFVVESQDPVDMHMVRPPAVPAVA